MLVFAEEVSIENDFKGTKKLKIFFFKGTSEIKPGDWDWHTCNAVCAAVKHWKLSSELCDDLGVGWGWGERKVQEGGDICVHMATSIYFIV